MGKQKSSARDRFLKAVERWKAEIKGAKSVEFVFMGESELLDRLARPKHRGRERFWWDEELLSPEHLQRLHREQSEVAGQRYRPELQVDVPIAADLEALGFGESHLTRFESACTCLLAGTRHCHPLHSDHSADLHAAYDAATGALDSLRQLVATHALTAATPNPLGALREEAKRVHQILLRLDDVVAAARPDHAEDPELKGKQRFEQLLRDIWGARRALEAIDQFVTFLNCDASRAMESRRYFLTGEAGSGKTHLLLDSCRQALTEGRPAAVLFGDQFGLADLWPAVCSMLGLPTNLGKEELLGILDAAGAASGVTGRRFVLMIDALNDTHQPGFWSAQLPALFAAIRQWRHVAVAVSCRDVFLDAVDPESRRLDGVVRSHPGFAGCEVEACHKYFAFYGLQEPTIPLLLPEFTNPLFLGMYCAAVKDGDLEAGGHQYAGRTEVFAGFVRAKCKAVAWRLCPGGTAPELDAVRQALEQALGSIVSHVAASSFEAIPWDEALTAIRPAVEPPGLQPSRVLGLLRSEGLLADGPSFSPAGSQRNLRIGFQAFSDFLVLRHRMQSSTSPAVDDPSFVEWLLAAGPGIQEAATVALPEVLGVELMDACDSRLSSADGGRSKAARMRWLRDRFVTTLPYRKPASIGDRTLAILNECLREQPARVFNALFVTAPLPDHRLNSLWLHSFLTPLGLARRDAFFGIHTYHAYYDEASGAARVARWAAGGPYPGYDPTVVELACVPLVWLLSSPNRPMKDWTTKALVQLLRGHPDALQHLLERFLDVDDPYVLERLVAVAYGAALRASPSTRAAFAPVCQLVKSRVLEHPKKFRPDPLLLDAARGLVDWGVHHGLLAGDPSLAVWGAIGFPRPGPAPRKERLDTLYPSDPGLAEEASYSTLRYSLVDGIADFGHYVVESTISSYSVVPLTQPRPARDEPEPLRPRFSKSKLKKFIAGLSEEERRSWPSAERLASEWSDRGGALAWLVDVLPPQKVSEYLGCWGITSSRPPKDLRYPGGAARRWVLHRAVALGWDPKLFGRFDRHLARGLDGVSGPRAERFGKKYQWIAFRELLARVADNFHRLPGYWGDEGSVTAVAPFLRDLDPSLPPVPFVEIFGMDPESTGLPPQSVPTIDDVPRWPPKLMELSTYRGDIEAFVRDDDCLPWPEAVCLCGNPGGEEWVALDGRVLTREQQSRADETFHGLDEWFHVASWLTPAGDGARLASSFAALRWKFRSALLEEHGHCSCCYLGELGWRKTGCTHRHESFLDVGLPDGTHVHAAFSTEEYLWELGARDCSLPESAQAAAPSAFLRSKSDLWWSGNRPEWFSGSKLTITCLGDFGWDGSWALVARRAWLAQVLRDAQMDLVVVTYGERRSIQPYPSEPRKRLDFAGSMVLESDGSIQSVARESRVRLPGK